MIVNTLRKIRKAQKEFFFRLKIRRYQKQLPILEQAIVRKKKVRVVFFVINIGMWKGDNLFSRLLADDRYEPYVMSFLYPQDSMEYRRYVQDDIQRYFENKGFPFIPCYNFDSNEWFDIQSLKPDIVFYAQPYNVGYKPYLIESLWKMSLFAYIPYCFEMEGSPLYHHLLLQEIAWKMFYPTKFHKDLEESFRYSKRDNIVVTGYLSADKLLQTNRTEGNSWKISDPSFKRVIWAPHHSINGKDGIDYSNFLSLAEDMIAIAQQFADKIQFAFKPHPRLKEKLYNLEGWELREQISIIINGQK